MAILGVLTVAACARSGGGAVPISPLTEPVVPTGPVYQLDDVLGADAPTLTSLLGEPSLSRREGAGEYRLYALTACSLIVIMYPDDAGVARADHVSAAALRSDQDKPSLTQCLAAG